MSTLDDFGRRVKADDRPDYDKQSRHYALKCLDDYRRELGSGHPEPEQYSLEEVYLTGCDDEPGSLQGFGWCLKELPEFEVIWQKATKTDQLTEDKDPAPQSKVYELIKGLLVLHFGKEILSKLEKERSEDVERVRQALACKGYNFDAKTLRKYIKR